MVDAEVGTSLADVLREELGLTGTKVACNEGHCGAQPARRHPGALVLTLVHTVGDREVTTIEGLRDHPLVEAFVRTDAMQCGFCTPGQIVSAAALVAANPSPSPEEIRHGMAGNLCRCGTYPKIEERFRRGKADPHREGGRGPLHRAVDRGRGGHARPVARRALDVVGQPARRLDGLQRARGEARYTADIQLPGMLHAAVLRSPHAHARVQRLDLEPHARPPASAPCSAR